MVERRAVFIAGGHTDVGKTHVACALLRAARGRDWSAAVVKPVVSGFDPGDLAASDPGRLLAALDQDVSPESVAAISGWRLRAPLSPPMAARREGVRLRLEEVVAFCRSRLAAHRSAFCVVEGVGGLMSPLAEAASGLDLMIALQLPAILVGGSYLGGVTHLLTAKVAAESRGVRVLALVVSESGEADAPDFAETVADVAALAEGTPVVAAPRDSRVGWPERLLDLL